MKEVEFLKVGRFLGTHGIRGEVKLLSETDFPEDRFAPGQVLMLQHATLTAPLPLTVERSRPHKNAYLVKFREWDNINQAEPFKGGTFVVPATDVVSLDTEAGEYYFKDIISCEVVTTEGRRVGKVKEILTLPANDVWVVATEDGNEILLPYIDDIVNEIDVASKQITIDWMEGLE
ncbi:16S rRNA processing protein RimM [Thermoactinomyces sp. DSM 45891]|uniref:ribosome maturation factor RimM n=1 Tax=Thermoactinomyces sp. DSM 45891 TaxID=1761907 RepID=UPI00091F71A9|nr:ribosome maturation factor RimM [Thermoactinomyces sp. DSM 45891]SFX05070.1 16S rRNA processing protein RimM [Thermoactinomyces sp. DSM 45891]